MSETPETDEYVEALATEDPTNGELEATEFPEDEYPDPPNDPRREVVGLLVED